MRNHELNPGHISLAELHDLGVSFADLAFLIRLAWF
jgi:hypothetical protein